MPGFRAQSWFWVIVIVLASGLAPRQVSAQETAISAEIVVRLFQAGLSGTGVMNELRGRCIDFRASNPEIQQRLRTAGADDAFLEQLQTLCFAGPPEAQAPVAQVPAGTAPRPLLSPGGAALRSLVIPGFGQIYTGRPVIGALFLAAAGGALAAGAMSESVTVYCLSAPHGDCPPEHVANEVSESKLPLGIAGFAAAGVVAAIEAYSSANRLNTARMAQRVESSTAPRAPRLTMPLARASADGVRFELVRIRF